MVQPCPQCIAHYRTPARLLAEIMPLFRHSRFACTVVAMLSQAQQEFCYFVVALVWCVVYFWRTPSSRSTGYFMPYSVYDTSILYIL